MGGKLGNVSGGGTASRYQTPVHSEMFTRRASTGALLLCGYPMAIIL